MEARDRLERNWVDSRQDATVASEFPEALARFERAVLRAIHNGAEIVGSAAEAEIELADKLGDERARREFLGAVELGQRDAVDAEDPVALLCRYFDIHDKYGLSAIHFVLGAGRLGKILQLRSPKRHRTAEAVGHVSPGSDAVTKEVQDQRRYQHELDFDDKANSDNSGLEQGGQRWPRSRVLR